MNSQLHTRGTPDALFRSAQYVVLDRAVGGPSINIRHGSGKWGRFGVKVADRRVHGRSNTPPKTTRWSRFASRPDGRRNQGMSNPEIQSLIQSFATQLEAAARRAALEQVMATLGGVAPAAPGKRRGRPKGSKNVKSPAAPATATASPKLKPVRKGKRRTAEDVEAMGATLVEYVKTHPGQLGEEIAKALGTDVGTMRLPMQALMKAKKVKTQGQRRGTRYYVAGAVPAKAAKAAKKKRTKK